MQSGDEAIPPAVPRPPYPEDGEGAASKGLTMGLEEDTCRICRSGAEEGEPLYHPCKCSGSIAKVHQDCLIEWLQHSKKKVSLHQPELVSSSEAEQRGAVSSHASCATRSCSSTRSTPPRCLRSSRRTSTSSGSASSPSSLSASRSALCSSSLPGWPSCRWATSTSGAFTSGPSMSL